MSLSTDYSTSASQANHNKINAEDIRNWPWAKTN